MGVLFEWIGYDNSMDFLVSFSDLNQLIWVSLWNLKVSMRQAVYRAEIQIFIELPSKFWIAFNQSIS